MHNLLNLLKMLLKLRRRRLPNQRSSQSTKELRPDLLTPAARLLVAILRAVIVLALTVMHPRIRRIDRHARDLEGRAAFTGGVDGDAAGFGGVEDVVGEGDEVEPGGELALAARLAADDVPGLHAPGVEEALHGVVRRRVAVDAADGAVGDEGEGAVFGEGLPGASHHRLRGGEVCAFHHDRHVYGPVGYCFVALLRFAGGEGEAASALFVLGAPGAHCHAGVREAVGRGVGDVDVAEVAGEGWGVDA